MPTVLVIDENIESLEFVRRALTGAGHTVVSLTSAEAAFEILTGEVFDVVLIEVLSHAKEGVETIVELRQRWPRMPIIAMSGGGAVVSASRALSIAKAVGARETLEKPFSASELVWTVERVASGG